MTRFECAVRRNLAPVLALALLAIPANAAEAWESDVRAAFAQADVNSDDVINVDEFVGYSVALFASLDQNEDGFLYPAEFPEVNEEDFAIDDRDQDGRLSLGEAVAGKIIEGFEADTNRDGVLTVEEVIEAERRYRAEKGIQP